MSRKLILLFLFNWKSLQESSFSDKIIKIITTIITVKTWKVNKVPSASSEESSEVLFPWQRGESSPIAVEQLSDHPEVPQGNVLGGCLT